MNTGKVPWDVGPEWVLVDVGFGCEGEGKGETQKHVFRRAARHTHIISKTLQSDSVMLLGGLGVGIRLLWGWLVCEEKGACAPCEYY